MKTFDRKKYSSNYQISEPIVRFPKEKFTLHPTSQSGDNEHFYISFVQEDKRFYVVDKDYKNINSLCANKIISYVNLYYAIDSKEDEFLLPVYLSGHATKYYLDIMNTARQGVWFIKSNEKNAYYPDESVNKIVQWKSSFDDLLTKAFNGYTIDDENHPVAQKYFK